MERTERLAEIIEEEVARALGTFADDLRAAAWFAIDEFPDVTSREFGDAAAACDLHRQGAMNRFNEAKKNLELFYAA